MGSRTETTCRLEDPSKSTGQWYRSSQPGSPDLTAKRAAEPSQPSGCLAETSSQVAEACQQILRLPLSIMYVVPSSSICKNMERPTEYWGSRCHASLADKFSDSPDKFENAQLPARDAGLCGDQCSSLSSADNSVSHPLSPQDSVLRCPVVL